MVISDLHAGSAVGLCPPNFRLDDGTWELSTIQQAIYAHWQNFWGDFIPKATNGQPYAVAVNGDLVEGKHHRWGQLISTNEADHVRAAVKLLEPIRDRAQAFYIIRGTEAHGGGCGALEEMVADKLKADSTKPIKSHWQLWLELGDRLIHLAHHIGATSSSAYEHSALSRELVANLVESAQWGERPADLIVRSHRHRAAGATIPTNRGTASIIVTPGWQARTAFTQRTVSMRLPQIGGVVITRDPYGLIVRRYTWALPRDGVVPLTRAAARRSLDPKTTGEKSQRSTGKRSSAGRSKAKTRTGRRRPR